MTGWAQGSPSHECHQGKLRFGSPGSMRWTEWGPELSDSQVTPVGFPWLLTQCHEGTCAVGDQQGLSVNYPRKGRLRDWGGGLSPGCKSVPLFQKAGCMQLTGNSNIDAPCSPVAGQCVPSRSAGVCTGNTRGSLGRVCERETRTASRSTHRGGQCHAVYYRTAA